MLKIDNTRLIITEYDCSYSPYSSNKLSGDNTEKIWAHQLFVRQKADVPKACKIASAILWNKSQGQ